MRGYGKVQNTPTRARAQLGTRCGTRRQTRQSRDCPHTNATTDANSNATLVLRRPKYCDLWSNISQYYHKGRKYCGPKLQECSNDSFQAFEKVSRGKTTNLHISKMAATKEAKTITFESKEEPNVHEIR